MTKSAPQAVVAIFGIIAVCTAAWALKAPGALWALLLVIWIVESLDKN